MRIYCLEIKRVLKSRRVIILLTIALLMSMVMAWLPVIFEDINQYDDNGNKVAELNGLSAINYKKSLRQTNNGEVTPEKIKEALIIYQNTVSQYGENSLYKGPLYEKGLSRGIAFRKTAGGVFKSKDWSGSKSNGDRPGKNRQLL